MSAPTLSPRTSSYWEKDLGPAPARHEVPRELDVLIVGAGLMGRWLAYFYGQRAPQKIVAVIEADHFGYGASTRNAGFLTSGDVSESLADAQRVGQDAVIANFLARREGAALVQREFPHLAFDRCGSADFDPLEPATLDFAQVLNKAAGKAIYSVKELLFAGKSVRVLFNCEDVGVHPVEVMRALAARSPSIRYCFSQRILSIGQGIAHLATREVRYQKAIICTNAFARQLVPSSRVVPGRGQIIVTSPIMAQSTATLGYLNQGYDYFRFVDGRLLLGGGRNRFRAEEQTFEIATTSGVRQHLVELATKIIGHDQWQVEHHWAGIMGFLDDQHLGGSPRMCLDDQTELVAGFGGMGVALTPITAQRLAAEL